MSILKTAIIEAGGARIVANECGLKSYQAVLKWMNSGHLPRTEWTGETNYVDVICSLQSKFKKKQLLGTRGQAA